MTTSSSAEEFTREDALSFLRRSDPAEPVIALISAGDPSAAWSRRSLVARPAARLDVRGLSDLPGFFAALGPRAVAPRDRGSFGVVAALDYELGALLETAVPLRPRPMGSAPFATLLRLSEPLDAGGDRWPIDPRYTVSPLRETATRRDFVEAVRSALGLIAAGDIYQVNLTHPLRARVRGNIRALAADAIENTGAWFGACIELPERAIVSASPELLVRVAPGGRVTARPIKGTRPTGGEAELARSGKDAAELAMIVDLMRNDLGRLCRLGSVRVEAPRMIESHAGVVHTVAEISGDLRAEVEWEDVIRAVFPAGSITGAPKIRAQQIIDELETAHRGVYCGSILWLAEDGTMDLSVNIRTAEIVGRELTFGVGAGIVADSDPEAERRETLEKAEGFTRAVGSTVEADR